MQFLTYFGAQLVELAARATMTATRRRFMGSKGLDEVFSEFVRSESVMTLMGQSS